MISTKTLPPPKKTSDLSTYNELKHRVRETLALGLGRAEKAYEREMVRAKWEVGKLIQEHILLNKTRAGQEAKRFVERELRKVSQVVITSTKSDKYDRYLADVFYTVDGKERFLNNRLLERGLAVRV